MESNVPCSQVLNPRPGDIISKHWLNTNAVPRSWSAPIHEAQSLPAVSIICQNVSLLNQRTKVLFSCKLNSKLPACQMEILWAFPNLVCNEIDQWAPNGLNALNSKMNISKIWILFLHFSGNWRVSKSLSSSFCFHQW